MNFLTRNIAFAISRRMRMISDIPYIFFTGIWSVRLRANCTTNKEILRQSKDAALKFRGCFQAVCEPRSSSHRSEGGG